MADTLCAECHAKPVDRDGLCFRCRIVGTGFTFRSAHLGRKGFHMSTVEREKKDLFESARRNKIDIERVR